MKTFYSLFVGFALCLTLPNLASAQAYSEENKDLNVGIGLVSTFFGSGLDGRIPPVTISYEQGVAENIGVGGLIGFATARYDYSFADYYWRYTYILFGARGAYHFNLADDPKLDTYVGAMLGFYYGRADFVDKGSGIDEDLLDSPDASSFGYYFFGGARYHFNEKIGVYGELGYGLAILNVGITARL